MNQDRFQVVASKGLFSLEEFSGSEKSILGIFIEINKNYEQRNLVKTS